MRVQKRIINIHSFIHSFIQVPTSKCLKEDTPLSFLCDKFFGVSYSTKVERVIVDAHVLQSLVKDVNNNFFSLFVSLEV